MLRCQTDLSKEAGVIGDLLRAKLNLLPKQIQPVSVEFMIGEIRCSDCCVKLMEHDHLGPPIVMVEFGKPCY